MRGVAERVLGHHQPLGHALGARRPHVVLAQDLEDARARHARDHGHRRAGRASRRAGRGARACPRRPRAARGATARRPRSARAPSRTRAWTGRTARRAGRSRRRTSSATPPTRPPRSRRARAAITSAAMVSWSVAGHASASSSTTGRFCWIDRPRSPLARRPDVLHVADGQGLVEAQVVPQAGHRVLGGVLAEHEGHGVARDQLDGEHHHEDDAEQHGHGEQQPAEDEGQHDARAGARAARWPARGSRPSGAPPGAAPGRYLSSQVFPSQRLYSTGWTTKPFT